MFKIEFITIKVKNISGSPTLDVIKCNNKYYYNLKVILIPYDAIKEIALYNSSNNYIVKGHQWGNRNRRKILKSIIMYESYQKD